MASEKRLKHLAKMKELDEMCVKMVRERKKPEVIHAVRALYLIERKKAGLP